MGIRPLTAKDIVARAIGRHMSSKERIVGQHEAVARSVIADLEAEGWSIQPPDGAFMKAKERQRGR